ncbi:MAG TPA: trypsin-like serine protease [Thermoleophilaceae bacterium]|nr:trypsin-like serine protease [Thermoleophilaceae bacterium]
MTPRRAIGLSLALLVSAALTAPALVSAQDFETRIVGGTTAEPGEYPWQVTVLKKQGQSLYFICGGTLIADQRVVTAAHCTSGSAASLKVLVGTQQLSTGGSILAVSSYADHPSYSSSTDRFDAAVLELATSGISAGGQTLSLIGEEGSGDDALWAPGKLLAISGWGATSEGGFTSDQLREAQVPRVADSTCGQGDYYGSAFDPATMVCAGPAAGGVDTCQGDSGGPLAASTQDPLPASQNNPSQWRLAGITSWGEGCARAKKPGVYTRVAAPAIRDWILGTTPIFALSVSLSGTGSGTVTSNPGDINCPPDCSFGYASGTDVTLTATADSGSDFTGWTGAGCSGTGTCTVSMDQAREVTATFGLEAAIPSPPAAESSLAPTLTPGAEPETADTSAPMAAIASNRLLMSRRGYVRVRIDCSASPEDCLGVVRLRLRFPATAALRTVGRATFDITAGDSRRVRLRLTRRARRLVRREGRVRVRVVAVVHDAAGNRRTLRKRLTLRAAR